MNANAIGVFDSGLGGISVLNRCIELLPNEDFIYYADKKNAPYGDKTTDEIIDCVDNAIKDFFIPNNIKALVLACNTATNAAIDVLRKKYDIPIIGTEPAIKPAMLKTKDKKTLIIATDATVNSLKFKDKIKNYDPNKYIAMGCSGLVELIEANEKDKITEYFKKKFENLEVQDISSVVLGCTHYPFVKDEIKSVLSCDLSFFDGGEGVARRLESVLDESNLKFLGKKIGDVNIYNSLCDNYNNKIKEYLGR